MLRLILLVMALTAGCRSYPVEEGNLAIEELKQNISLIWTEVSQLKDSFQKHIERSDAPSDHYHHEYDHHHDDYHHDPHHDDHHAEDTRTHDQHHAEDTHTHDQHHAEDTHTHDQHHAEDTHTHDQHHAEDSHTQDGHQPEHDGREGRDFHSNEDDQHHHEPHSGKEGEEDHHDKSNEEENNISGEEEPRPEAERIQKTSRRLDLRQSREHDRHHRRHHHHHHNHHKGSDMFEAHCYLTPNAENPQSNVTGHVTFKQSKDGKGPVYLDVELSGFEPSEDGAGTIHGFHVHENKVQEEQCSTAGGHFNPTGQTHGAPYSLIRHVGDLGNVRVSNEGDLKKYILTDDVVQLGGKNSVVGRSIVVHELEDDLGQGGDDGSRATGNAGARLACCTIEGKNLPPSISPAIRFNG